MFGVLAARYDLMNRLMSGGRDLAWRRYAIQQIALPTNATVLDVATGTADLALELARQHPECYIIGLDFCSEMLTLGREKTLAAGVAARITFLTGDALHLPFPSDSFDAVTSAFLLRNVTSLYQTLAEQYRVVRPGGWLVCLEICRPTWPFFREAFWLYFHYLVPILGRLFSSWAPGYTYLPQSVDHFLTPQELQTVMREAGWQKIQYHRLMLDSVAVYVGVKGGTPLDKEARRR